MAWEALTPTADPQVRHCARCDRDVVACDDAAAARRQAQRGACVALATRTTPGLGVRAVAPGVRGKVVGNFRTEDLGPPQVAWLVPLDGGIAGTTIPLGPATSILTTRDVGGDPGLATAIQLVPGPAGWTLLDDDARAGLHVNGVAVVRFELVDGDIIEFGGIRIAFKSAC